MIYSAENPPAKSLILENFGDNRLLATRTPGALETFPVVRELIADGSAFIQERQIGFGTADQYTAYFLAPT